MFVECFNYITLYTHFCFMYILPLIEYVGPTEPPPAEHPLVYREFSRPREPLLSLREQ